MDRMWAQFCFGAAFGMALSRLFFGPVSHRVVHLLVAALLLAIGLAAMASEKRS